MGLLVLLAVDSSVGELVAANLLEFSAEGLLTPRFDSSLDGLLATPSLSGADGLQATPALAFSPGGLLQKGTMSVIHKKNQGPLIQR